MASSPPSLATADGCRTPQEQWISLLWALRGLFSSVIVCTQDRLQIAHLQACCLHPDAAGLGTVEAPLSVHILYTGEDQSRGPPASGLQWMPLPSCHPDMVPLEEAMPERVSRHAVLKGMQVVHIVGFRISLEVPHDGAAPGARRGLTPGISAVVPPSEWQHARATWLSSEGRWRVMCWSEEQQDAVVNRASMCFGERIQGPTWKSSVSLLCVQVCV